MQDPTAPINRLYTRDYYLSDCEGHAEFARTAGRKLSRRLAKCLSLSRAKPGEHWVDVGCGRGELSLHLAARGVTVVAVDPSAAALGILAAARSVWTEARTLRAQLPAVPIIVRGLGEHLPFASGRADGVVLSDVVEHLTAPRLERLLEECRRVLRVGGRLVIHTQPNRTLLRFTVPLLARISRLWGVHVPVDLRREMTPGSGPEYHPNEQSASGLRRSLRRGGFAIDEFWLEGSYPIHRIFGDSALKAPVLKLFRENRLLRVLLASQIFAVARKLDVT